MSRGYIMRRQIYIEKFAEKLLGKWGNTGKVSEFCQSEKVGTMPLYRNTLTATHKFI